MIIQRAKYDCSETAIYIKVSYATFTFLDVKIKSRKLLLLFKIHNIFCSFLVNCIKRVLENHNFYSYQLNQSAQRRSRVVGITQMIKRLNWGGGGEMHEQQKLKRLSPTF